ncbi:helix-turn-helix domain-containing protein [Blautia sp. HCN-1074]|jgi:transcriptional regulator with XRE-family HTH domain|uniref:Helix-turn-helix XRE-family like protein n=1 Tax=Myoviridae sp. ctMne5 TaxID=2825089 RepID=A0A8S5TZT0_9CAUD|nr:XRE family transcriptional regulator [Ruminococcus sp. TM10-9AT]RHQ67750.1 XRE family transcriptional regulator [Ruminococcus sp. AF24-32LB]UWF98236.1 MAG: helix-turn-helix domain protein [Bacteriophage sp.]DAF87691.1 MAG TPA: Helix-turn-helix XRE-family like protein [Myoviridae sp. ctMne5]
MTLGDIIKNYRDRNNITIGEFASACSLSKGYISMLENNINPRNNKPISPTLPSMAKVASGMGIELDTLLKMLDGKQSIQLIEDNADSIQAVSSSSQCKEIIEVCEQLSAHNQRKVLTYSKNLLSTQQMEDDLLPNAAHEMNPTEEQKKHADDVMKDDKEWI